MTENIFQPQPLTLDGPNAIYAYAQRNKDAQMQARKIEAANHAWVEVNLLPWLTDVRWDKTS